VNQQSVTDAATVEANKRLAVRWLELVSAGDVDELCRMTDASWTMDGGPPHLPVGPDGIRALFATFGEITQTWQVEDVIAEGDKVVVRATNRCVQDSFLERPANEDGGVSMRVEARTRADHRGADAR